MLKLNKVVNADLRGNGIYKKLNVSNMQFYKFPTEFTCRFLNELEIIDAKNVQMRVINPCIGKFQQLLLFDVANNNIQPHGIPKEILDLYTNKKTASNNTMNLRIRNNPAAYNLSFRGNNLKTDKHNEKLKAFIINNFNNTIMHLDLSDNELTGSNILRDLLYECLNLEIVNGSKNEFGYIFEEGTILEKYDVSKVFLKLKVLDLSNNPIRHVHVKLALFFQYWYDYHNQTIKKHMVLKNNVIRETMFFNFANDGDQFPKYLYDQLTNLQAVYIVKMYEKLPTFDYWCKFQFLNDFDIEIEKKLSSNYALPQCFRNLKELFITTKTEVAERSTANLTWPSDFFSGKLSELRIYNCGMCNLKIPVLKTKSNLKFFALRNTNVTGSLNELNDVFLPDMNQLSFRQNDIFGNIPEWEGMKNLVYLDLTLNNLSGVVPSNLYVLHPGLFHLYLAQNLQLNGVLPDLPKNASLKCLDIRGTNISNSVSEYYFNITDGELFLPYKPNTKLLGENILPGSAIQVGTMECKVCQKKRNVTNGTIFHHICNNKIRGEHLKYTREDKYIWCHSFTKKEMKGCIVEEHYFNAKYSVSLVSHYDRYGYGDVVRV